MEGDRTGGEGRGGHKGQCMKDRRGKVQESWERERKGEKGSTCMFERVRVGRGDLERHVS